MFELELKPHMLSEKEGERGLWEGGVLEGTGDCGGRWLGNGRGGCWDVTGGFRLRATAASASVSIEEGRRDGDYLK